MSQSKNNTKILITLVNDKKNKMIYLKIMQKIEIDL